MNGDATSNEEHCCVSHEVEVATVAGAAGVLPVASCMPLSCCLVHPLL